MVLFLEGVVAQVVISDGKNGSYLSINIVTGVAVMLGMLVAGPVTGAHLNPAITVAFAIFQGFPLRKIPGYVISQVRFHVSAATRCWLLLCSLFLFRFPQADIDLISYWVALLVPHWFTQITEAASIL
jgi:glycerol uptake facilitator-like aquaporin